MGVTRPPGYGTHVRPVGAEPTRHRSARPGLARTLRTQAGAPQHLVVTLLGDYWIARTEPLPVSGYVALLGELGVTEAATRATLQRMAGRGLLRSTREGRRALYGLAPGVADDLALGAHRFLGFASAPEPWDGAWTLALFRLGERDRDTRHRLYARLRELGFGPLYDGAWVAVRDHAAETVAAVAELGIADVTVLAVPHERIAVGNPVIAWDLDALAAAYRDFAEEFAPVLADARAGRLTGAAALAARVGVMTRWRALPDEDPRLPAELLPAGWPMPEAFAVYRETYDLLGAVAAAHVREVLAADAPALAPFVVHRTVAETVELGAQALRWSRTRAGSGTTA